jgi:hypothetical protein
MAEAVPIAQAVSTPVSHRSGAGSIPSHMAFVVDKLALEHIFSENFCLPLSILIPQNAPYSSTTMLTRQDCRYQHNY